MQLSLFHNPQDHNVAATCSITALICAAMNRAAAACPCSRAQIVERMNLLALASGRRMTQGKAKTISLDTLEKWLNPESGVTPSLQALDIFMRALGSGGSAPLEAWAHTFGFGLLTPEKAELCAYAQEVLEGKARTSRKNDLEKKLLRRIAP